MKKNVYVSLGFLMVGLGAAGIFLPLLPTTPFLLLAAYLFARSSDRCHSWLLNHRYFGPYIHAFQNRTGLTKSQKVRIGLSFTVLLAISVCVAPLPSVKVFLVALWLFWSFALCRMKTAGMEPDRS